MSLRVRDMTACVCAKAGCTTTGKVYDKYRMRNKVVSGRVEGDLKDVYDKREHGVAMVWPHGGRLVAPRMKVRRAVSRCVPGGRVAGIWRVDGWGRPGPAQHAAEECYAVYLGKCQSSAEPPAALLPVPERLAEGVPRAGRVRALMITPGPQLSSGSTLPHRKQFCWSNAMDQRCIFRLHLLLLHRRQGVRMWGL